MLNPLPSLNYAYSVLIQSVLIQEESQGEVVGSITSNFDATMLYSFVVGGNASLLNGSLSKIKCDWQCTFCGKKRHKIDTCWQKNGVLVDIRKR